MDSLFTHGLSKRRLSLGSICTNSKVPGALHLFNILLLTPISKCFIRRTEKSHTDDADRDDEKNCDRDRESDVARIFGFGKTVWRRIAGAFIVLGLALILKPTHTIVLDILSGVYMLSLSMLPSIFLSLSILFSIFLSLYFLTNQPTHPPTLTRTLQCMRRRTHSFTHYGNTHASTHSLSGH